MILFGTAACCFMDDPYITVYFSKHMSTQYYYCDVTAERKDLQRNLFFFNLKVDAKDTRAAQVLVITASLYLSPSVLQANEDGVSSRGSAGDGDCCERDGESADHPGTDRHFGTGNGRGLSPGTEHIEKAFLCMLENAKFAPVCDSRRQGVLLPCVTSGSRYL